MKKVIITLLLVVVASVAYAGYVCQIDNSSMMWTGNTQVEWGKMLKEYRCLMGHVMWVAN